MWTAVVLFLYIILVSLKIQLASARNVSITSRNFTIPSKMVGWIVIDLKMDSEVLSRNERKIWWTVAYDSRQLWCHEMDVSFPGVRFEFLTPRSPVKCRTLYLSLIAHNKIRNRCVRYVAWYSWSKHVLRVVQNALLIQDRQSGVFAKDNYCT